MPQTTIVRNLKDFSFAWNSDTKNTLLPCTGSCSQLTRGRVDGKPICLSCTVSKARKAQ